MKVTETGPLHTGSDTTCSESFASCESFQSALWKSQPSALRASDLTPGILARFHAKYQKSAKGCWLWKSTMVKAYGQFYVGRDLRTGRLVKHYAHRVAYAIKHGLAPAGLEVMHGCDTPGCVNPAHLSLGTHRQNIADREAKGRGKKESPNIRKITVEGVREIRESNQPSAYFARKWNVCVSHINRIRRGEKRKVS
jgi:hypothetical protein